MTSIYLLLFSQKKQNQRPNECLPPSENTWNPVNGQLPSGWPSALGRTLTFTDFYVFSDSLPPAAHWGRPARCLLNPYWISTNFAKRSMDRLLIQEQNRIPPGGMATANAVLLRNELENTCKSAKASARRRRAECLPRRHDEALLCLDLRYFSRAGRQSFAESIWFFML